VQVKTRKAPLVKVDLTQPTFSHDFYLKKKI